MTGGDGRRGWRGSVLLLIGLAIAANGLGQGFSRFTYLQLLPDMRDDLIGSYSLAGLLGTINLVAYLVAVLVVSWFAGRISIVLVVAGGLGLCTVGSLVLAAAHSYATLAFGMVLLGGGAAGTWVPLAGVVTASVPANRRGLALGALTTGFGISILLAAQLRSAVYSVGGEGSWRAVWVIQAILVGLTCIACAFLFRPSAAATARSHGHPLALLRSVPGWGRLTMAYVAVAVGYVIYASYLSALLEKEAHFSPSHTSAVFSVIGVVAVIGAIVTGRLADRVGWRFAFAASCTAMATCGLLVLARTEPWVMLSGVLYGLPLTTTGAFVAGYLGDHLRGAAIGAAFGAITIPFGISQAVAPWLGGWMRDASGSFTATFLLSVTAFLLATIGALSLPSARRVAARTVLE